MADNVNLRLVLAALCHIVEAMRTSPLAVPGADALLKHDEITKCNERCSKFRETLAETSVDEEKLLPITLMHMITSFCSGSAAHYPMRKVVVISILT